MKKYLIMAAMMVATLTAGAQARFEAGTFTMQPRLGGTGAMLTNTPDLKVEGQTIEATATGGEFVGLDFEYYLNKRLGIAAGINVAAAGTGWEDYNYTDDDGQKMKMKEQAYKTRYVNVPITANWYVLKGFALKAGVQFGFLTGADDYSRAECSVLSTDYTIIAEEDIKDNFNKFDISIPIGLSYEFKVPIVIDLRYNFGVTKVNKHKTTTGDDMRNINAALTLGSKFSL